MCKTSVKNATLDADLQRTVASDRQPEIDSSMLALTDEFRFRLSVPEVDASDVEHVTRVLVGKVGVIWVDVERAPVLLGQFERNSFDCNNLSYITCTFIDDVRASSMA